MQWKEIEQVLHNLTAIPWAKAGKRKLLDSVSMSSSQETLADTLPQDSMPVSDTVVQDTLEADTVVQDTPQPTPIACTPLIAKSGSSLYLVQKLYVNII